jgi:short-subunit dehydrogenase
MSAQPHDFQNKWALITGASSGIGKAFAFALAKRGAHLILVARSEEALQQIAREVVERFKIRAEIVVLDLSKTEAPQKLQTVVESLGHPVRVLVNNAGFGTYGPLQENSIDENSREVLLNVHTLAQLTQLFLPAMQQARDGAIVNVASTAGFQSTPYMAIYGATKAFVLSFTEAVWAENLGTGVRVLALCPGPVETQFFDVLGSKQVAVTGKMDTPENTVATALRALDRGKAFVVSGPFRNYLLSQVNRFVPRAVTLRIGAQMLRPK